MTSKIIYPAKLPPADPIRDEEWRDPQDQVYALQQMFGEFSGRFREIDTILECRIDKIDEDQALLKAEKKELQEMLLFIRAEIKRTET